MGRRIDEQDEKWPVVATGTNLKMFPFQLNEIYRPNWPKGQSKDLITSHEAEKRTFFNPYLLTLILESTILSDFGLVYNKQPTDKCNLIKSGLKSVGGVDIRSSTHTIILQSCWLRQGQDLMGFGSFGERNIRKLTCSITCALDFVEGQSIRFINS